MSDSELEGECPLCKEVWDGRKEMGPCSNCGRWYHLSCIRTTLTAFEKLPAYTCMSCCKKGRIFKYQTLTITEASLKTLDGAIDDVIIDFFIMKTRDGLSGEQRAKTYFFPVFFYSKLTTGQTLINRKSKPDYKQQHSNVKSWTKYTNIFTKEKIFMFVNIARSHWILLVICHPLMKTTESNYRSGIKIYSKRACILVLDPLNKGAEVRAEVIENIHQYLTYEYQCRYPDVMVFGNHNLRALAPFVPQQPPGSVDCGAFVMKFMDCMLKFQIEDWRSPMDFSHWFSPEEGTDMRENVKQMLVKHELVKVRETRNNKMSRKPSLEREQEIEGKYRRKKLKTDKGSANEDERKEDHVNTVEMGIKKETYDEVESGTPIKSEDSDRKIKMNDASLNTDEKGIKKETYDEVESGTPIKSEDSDRKINMNDASLNTDGKGIKKETYDEVESGTPIKSEDSDRKINMNDASLNTDEKGIKKETYDEVESGTPIKSEDSDRKIKMNDASLNTDEKGIKKETYDEVESGTPIKSEDSDRKIKMNDASLNTVEKGIKKETYDEVESGTPIKSEDSDRKIKMNDASLNTDEKGIKKETYDEVESGTPIKSEDRDMKIKMNEASLNTGEKGIKKETYDEVESGTPIKSEGRDRKIKMNDASLNTGEKGIKKETDDEVESGTPIKSEDSDRKINMNDASLNTVEKGIKKETYDEVESATPINSGNSDRKINMNDASLNTVEKGIKKETYDEVESGTPIKSEDSDRKIKMNDASLNTVEKRIKKENDDEVESGAPIKSEDSDRKINMNDASLNSDEKGIKKETYDEVESGTPIKSEDSDRKIKMNDASLNTVEKGIKKETYDEVESGTPIKSEDSDRKINMNDASLNTDEKGIKKETYDEVESGTPIKSEDSDRKINMNDASLNTDEKGIKKETYDEVESGTPIKSEDSDRKINMNDASLNTDEKGIKKETDDEVESGTPIKSEDSDGKMPSVAKKKTTASMKRKMETEIQEPGTVFKRQKKENVSDWGTIKSVKELESKENFAVVLSRVSPAPSNASKHQRQCVVSGAEVIRRVTGVENMSPPVLCQMLRLGKNTDAAKEISKLIQRVFPEKKRSYNISTFSTLTEEEVKMMAEDFGQLAATKIDSQSISKFVWEEAMTGTDDQRRAAIQGAMHMVEKIAIKLMDECTLFDEATHGGFQLMKTAFDTLLDIMKKANR